MVNLGKSKKVSKAIPVTGLAGLWGSDIYIHSCPDSIPGATRFPEK
jgi:hypothetical protein